MQKVLAYMMVSVVVSMYLFPFGLTFLPDFINTKNILALVGIPLLGYDALKSRNLRLPTSVLGGIGFAFLFSLVCLLSVDLNQTFDYSYATYFVSFFVWLFGAYTVSVSIRLAHGKANFKRLVYYLAFVCMMQCILALMIDRMPAFQQLVDTYIDQGQEFLMEVDRLYGIGASLDNAGVRFSVVLVLIAALLVKDAQVRDNRVTMSLLLLAFFIVALIGNMISRTTIVGVGFALFFLVQATGIFRFVLQPKFFKLHLVFGSIVAVGSVIAVFFYNTDPEFHAHIRFAFEGFFNWVERGEWRTDSTDKLNRTMWVWPSDTKTWIIGSGLFDDWIYGTDIGYCRFILYCGLVGFSIYAAFFAYNAIVFGKKNPAYIDLFFFLLVITFVIWIKVATDIFTFYALFYCLDYFASPVAVEKRNEETALSYENNLQHQRYV